MARITVIPGATSPGFLSTRSSMRTARSRAAGAQWRDPDETVMDLIRNPMISTRFFFVCFEEENLAALQKITGVP